MSFVDVDQNNKISVTKLSLSNEIKPFSIGDVSRQVKKYTTTIPTLIDFLRPSHEFEVSGLVKPLHNSIWELKIPNMVLFPPVFLSKTLKYMGIDIKTYDQQTKKFILKNGMVKPLRKIDPFNIIQTKLNESQTFYITITGDHYARAIRMYIDLHITTAYNRNWHFKNQYSHISFAKDFLGGMCYDGLFIVSKNSDFTDTSQYIMTAQLQALFQKPNSIFEHYDHNTREHARTNCRQILLTDILGKQHFKSKLSKQIFANVLQHIYSQQNKTCNIYFKTPQELYPLLNYYVSNDLEIMR